MSDPIHAAGLAALVLVLVRLSLAPLRAGVLARRAIRVRRCRPDFTGDRRRSW